MKKVLASTICALSLFGLSACNNQTTSSNTAPETASATNSGQKVYRVGSELSKFPVVIHDGKGNVSGFEAELLQAVADRQGLKIEYVLDNWSGLLNKLDNNQSDMILGSITITDERRKKMDFTEAVLPYKTGVMVNKNLSHLKSFRDLKGKKVNLRQNTVYEQLVPIFSNESGNNMVYPDSVWGQVKSLLSGESEAMVGASITLEYYKNQHPDQNFHIIYEDNAPISHYGWAVKKGENAELLHQLNVGLQQVKQDGTYEKIYRKYWADAPILK